MNRRLRWELERSLGGQLCQEYSYQKLVKSGQPSPSYNRQCRGSFWDTAYRAFDPVYPGSAVGRLQSCWVTGRIFLKCQSDCVVSTGS